MEPVPAEVEEHPMSSQWARDKRRRELEERERNPPLPTQRELAHQDKIRQYEYFLAEADKRFGDGAGALIISLVQNWIDLAEFQ